MAKIYVQHFPVVLQSSASFLATACPSGSMTCNGYAYLVGGIWGGCTMDAGSSVTIEQSFDSGSNWDIKSTCGTLTASTSFSTCVVIMGNAIRVTAHSSTCGVNPFRTLWQLRPI